MREWLVDLVGVEMAPFASWALAAAIVIILLIVVIAIAKKALGGAGGTRAKGRGPRLAVMDVAAIDQKRKLVLVRRDEVEHLLLIGGQNDLVVEPHILRVPASARGSRPEPTLRPEPEASLAPDRAQPAIAPPPALMQAPVIAPAVPTPQPPQPARAPSPRLQPSAGQKPQEARVQAASPLSRPVPRAPVNDMPLEASPQAPPPPALASAAAPFIAPPVAALPVASPVAPPVVSPTADPASVVAPVVSLGEPSRDLSQRREPTIERDSEAAPRVELGIGPDTATDAPRQDAVANGSAAPAPEPFATQSATRQRLEPIIQPPVLREDRIDPVIGDAPGTIAEPRTLIAEPREVEDSPSLPARAASAPGRPNDPSPRSPSDIEAPAAVGPGVSRMPASPAGEDDQPAAVPAEVQRRPSAGTARMPIDTLPGSTPPPMRRTELSPLTRTTAPFGGGNAGAPPLQRTPIGDAGAPVRRPLTSPPAAAPGAMSATPRPETDAPLQAPYVEATTSPSSSAASWSPFEQAPVTVAAADAIRPDAAQQTAKAPLSAGDRAVPAPARTATPFAPPPLPPVPASSPSVSTSAPAFASLGTSGASSGLIAAAERQREALRNRQNATGGNPADQRPASPAFVPPTPTTSSTTSFVLPPPSLDAGVLPGASDEPADRRPLSVKSFATTIQSMKPSYEPPQPASAPERGIDPSRFAAPPASTPEPAGQTTPPSSRLSVPPFVSRVVSEQRDTAPLQRPAPAPIGVAPAGIAPMTVAATTTGGGPVGDGSLEDFLSAELDSDFGNLSWEEEVPRAATAPEPVAETPPPRPLTLEEEMERLLGDFDFDVSDRKAK